MCGHAWSDLLFGNAQRKSREGGFLAVVFLITGLWAGMVVSAQSVGIGTVAPSPTARLDIWDTMRGLLIPRLTTVQRDAIQNPAHTLMIFNIDSFCLEVYDTVMGRWWTVSCPRYCMEPGCAVGIVGPTYVCVGDTVTYVAEGCGGGEVYLWSVPAGWEIVSGQGSDTVRVVADTTDGQVGVRVCNSCGCRKASVLSVAADTCGLFCIAIGGAGDDFAWDISPAPDGGFITVGYSNSFGQGDWDIYAVKISKTGSIQWTRVIGGGGNEEGWSVIATDDGGYILVGGTQSFGQGSDDVYIVKLDSSGNLVWTKTIGGSSVDKGTDIIQTTDGGFAVTGYTNSFGHGNWDVYVIKLDTGGNIKWQIAIGGTESEEGTSIIQTRDGRYFVITGWTYSFGQGGRDVYVVKIDTAGNLQWAITVGGSNHEEGVDIIETSDEGYIVVGRTLSFSQGNDDIYVVRLDSNGGLLWTKAIGGNGGDLGFSIAQTLDGGYVIGGTTASFGASDADFYMVKMDSLGNINWARMIHSFNNDIGASILQDQDGGYVFAGVRNFLGQGYADVLVVKLDSNGNISACAQGCQVVSGGGIVGSGGMVGSGGSVAIAGGIVGGGGTLNSGGTLINICQ